MNKSYAVVIWGQLRASCTVMDNFNKFLIEELDADLFVVGQITKTHIDDFIDVFDTPNKILYDPPDISKVFTHYDLLDKTKNNYMLNCCAQIYYNWHKINELFGDVLEQNYKYIILTRSDYLHLFPFPNILNVCDNNIDESKCWVYDGHEWGGINGTLICVPSTIIKHYLSSFYDYLQDSNNITTLNDRSLNIEGYMRFLFSNFKWTIGKIENNAFITATNAQEITTYGHVYYCQKYNVFFKYKDGLNQAFDALQKYDQQQKWVLTNMNNVSRIILT